MKIIYSRLGERADAVIKRILSSDRREWIVVSSDRDIAGHAWAVGAVPIASEEFLPFVEGRKSDAGERADFGKGEDDEEAGGERKGNPKRLSRKARTTKRALGKL